MKSTLTEKTLIPMGLAITVIGGGAMWLTKIHFTQEASAKTLTELREAVSVDRRLTYDLLLNIDRRLSTIEGELKRLNK
jgi:hypothetical protein